ncbi:EamA family transporter [Methylobacterium nodulans]|uniref:EamA domain-containing protein n=1 Tax=Methylobacterium nodulans (strain LMG 21967 / CNCM I-2342 / ORS 2060) TaxID=460265 RepID=B8IW69_METNO|nr:DMT family transporter [Methylobacterium nodulans]ACL62659.1 protein of unknown function DUF6 transmembrane [Methylobacterium nodulans ORS 2060]
MALGHIRMHSSLLPILALLGSMIAQLSAGALSKSLFPSVGASGVTTLRTAFAAGILLAIWRPWRLPLTVREAWIIGIYGAALGLMNLLFFLSIESIPVGISVSIQFLGPLGVALLTSRRITDFVWIFLAVSGLFLLLPVQGTIALDLNGVAYACAGGLCWALYILFGRRAGLINGGQAVSLGMVAATIVVAPFGVASAGAGLFAAPIVIACLGIAVISSVLPYSLEMFALRRTTGQVFGILMSLQPAVGALVAFLLLQEVITIIQCLAISLIIMASVGIMFTENRVGTSYAAASMKRSSRSSGLS